MVGGPVSKAFLDEIDRHVQEEMLKKEKKEYIYKVRCSKCGRQVIKEYLIENGCFVCGWEGSNEKIELPRIKMTGKIISKTESYRMNCPNCGKQVIKGQFAENGCYICGFKE